MKYLEAMIPILKLGEEKREVVRRLCYDIADLKYIEEEKLKITSLFHIIYNILYDYNIKPINKWYSNDKEYFDDKPCYSL